MLILSEEINFMDFRIKITDNPRIGQVNLDDVVFGKVFSDHMFVMDYEDGDWNTGEIVPVSNFTVHPANLAWHYGQSIFEGMKASKHVDGTPMLFRPEMHARRINASATRMCMPMFPEEIFVKAVSDLVRIDKVWIPQKEGSSLYIRPFMFATEEFVGVRPSAKYRFVIFTCPVGPYYAKPVSLLAESFFVRAAIGGTGEAKAAGNYGGSLYPARLAQEQGYDQVLWLDPYEFKYPQEVGTMNIFFVMDGVIYTPPLDGAILKGITRDSFIKILKKMGYKVKEKNISMKKIFKAAKKGELTEVFGAGTAAVVSEVHRIAWREDEINLATEHYVVAPMLKDYINGLRSGRLNDQFGWIVRLE